MSTPKLTPSHPLWETYVRFHLGLFLNSQERMRAKDALFFVHYGTCDTTEADAEVARRREEIKT